MCTVASSSNADGLRRRSHQNLAHASVQQGHSTQRSHHGVGQGERRTPGPAWSAFLSALNKCNHFAFINTPFVHVFATSCPDLLTSSHSRLPGSPPQVAPRARGRPAVLGSVGFKDSERAAQQTADRSAEGSADPPMVSQLPNPLPNPYRPLCRPPLPTPSN